VETNLTVLAAIATALAAVVVSPFVTLRVAKQQIRSQTISANRHAWINSLREELAAFLSLITSLAFPVPVLDPNKFRESAEQLILVHSKIKLRLNPKEQDHIQLNDLLNQTYDSAISDDDKERRTVHKKRDEIVALSQVILKREWERVKAGD
jgi:hypothetical protein